MEEFRICPVGDQAVLLEFADVIDEETNSQVQAFAQQLQKKQIYGVTEILPTYRSLLVFYDDSRISYRRLAAKLCHRKPQKTGAAKEKRRIRMVPCLYGGIYGPDLSEMAGQLGMDEKEIIAIHQSVDYKIYMLGFLPGFVYLGGLDERIHMPRLTVPRTVIPARSVGIGGNQTGVYPMESPGGWRLIGSTPLNFYDPKEDPPVLCRAGEYIRFVPVSEREYECIRTDVERGVYRCEYV